MMDRRTIGLLLFFPQVVFIGFLTGEIIPVAMAFIIALPGYAGWLRWQPSIFKTTLAVLIVACFYLARWRIMPDSGSDDPMFSVLTGDYSLSATLALIFLTIQAVPFYNRARSDTYLMLPVCGVLALVFAGNIHNVRGTDTLYQAAVIAYVIGIAMFSRASLAEAPHDTPRRGGRWKLNTAVFGILIVVAILGSIGLAAFGNRFDHLISRSISPNQSGRIGGFTPHARLTSVYQMREGDEADKTALRIYADGPPGYLRGIVYTNADRSSSWRRSATQQMAPQLTRPPVPDAAHSGKAANYFRILGASGADRRAITVWPATQIGTLFTPKDTAEMALNVDALFRDECGVPELASGDYVSHYTAYALTQPPTMQLPALLRKPYLTVPADLNPGVRAIADGLFANKGSPRGKIAAVKRFFAAGFTYDTSFESPTGEDQLTHFLLNRQSGHCELFAFSTAILLRLGGVPARYVVGFHATEYNPLGEYWIARNKDAHAWVEAYDDETQRWEIVETTPPIGIPSGSGRSEWAYRWDAAMLWAAQAAAAVTEQGVTGLAQALAYVVVNWLDGRVPRAVMLAIAGGVMAVVVLRAAWRYRAERLARREPRRRAQLQLSRMDRVAARGGYVRGSAETINQFAQRLRQAHSDTFDGRGLAQWYEQFAVLRFSGAFDDEAAAQMERALVAIRRSALTRRAG